MKISDFDSCACGDYRRDHKDGVGACIHNKPGDLTHGFADCNEFRLHQRATEIPATYLRLIAGQAMSPQSKMLVLPLKAIYFDAIVKGEKPEEYRLNTAYWRKRLQGRSYAGIILKRGYPRNDETDRILVMPWRGCYLKTLTHPHFGPDPVEVFAINVDRREARP